ncbi:glycosyltransferase family 2 protein [Rasiella sp. SM2506]|uniref:glycosyltransferase family 2 protein n=1 Tax=Rasiella sp. SM2506 TaxID=3423914 RepID=UPI003D7A9FCF
MIQKPIVSVVVTTYNHQEYIVECLESILMQKTTFPFEIILGDDESLDDTREICKQYASRYPDTIRLFLRNRKDVIHINGNPTGRYNFIENLKACESEYIALCEGDDYWTDPLKLQKQVDFMEKNLDYGICFHKVAIYDESLKVLSHNVPTRNVPTETSIIDLASGNYIHTPSVLLRNDFNLPNWFCNTVIGDWTFYMIIIKDRKIKKIDDVMAVYRKHDNSIWSKKTKKHRILNTLKSFQLVQKNVVLSKKTHLALQESIISYKKQLSNLKVKNTSPLVSICIPTYNGALFLEEALESVKNQTYSPIEVIISDDNSNDNTLKIANKFKECVSFPVTIASHEPNGIGANWNNSIKLANGKFIKFLFQDDVLLPDCITEMVSIFRQHKNLGLVSCKRDLIVDNYTNPETNKWIRNYKNLQVQFDAENEDVMFIDKSFFSEPYFENPPKNKIGEPSSVMFKKNILDFVAGFDIDLKQSLDYVFYYRVLKVSRIAIINKSLVKFRLHKDQATNINRNKPIADYEIYKKILYKEFLPLLHPSHKKKLVLKFSKTACLKKKLKSVLKKFIP